MKIGVHLGWKSRHTRDWGRIVGPFGVSFFAFCSHNANLAFRFDISVFLKFLSNNVCLKSSNTKLGTVANDYNKKMCEMIRVMFVQKDR